MSSSLTAIIQPYTMCILDTHSAGGFASRQLITFQSSRRKIEFILFLRRKCSGRRRGDWSTVPGGRMMTKALEYAEKYGSFVYNLPVKKGPLASIKCVAGDDCEVGCAAECEVDNVVEEDLPL